jgi:flavin reductase (DIM6/NTAB) family NADH-FMN oxidoreductase RutF
VATSAFDEVVAAMDSAMVVVTVAVEDERDGCLVGFHSQASIEPTRYVVWLSTANRTTALARRADHLGVHLLGSHQHDVAELFGGESADDSDKLVRTTWEAGPSGVPLLVACPVRFAGRITARQETDGEHVGMVLEPVDAAWETPWTPLRLRDAIDIDPGHPA